MTSSNGSAQASLDSLIADFNDQPTLPEKVHQIGNKYRDSGKYERAIQFYQLAAERWPEDKIAITSRAAIGQVHIELGDDEAVGAIIDGLIADFNDHPALPEAVFIIGEQYYYKAFDDPKRCLKVKSEEHLKKAKAVWEKIITELPPSLFTAHAYYFSAVCYRRLGEYQEAMECYEEIVYSWPEYQSVRYAKFMIGCCLKKLKNGGRAWK